VTCREFSDFIGDYLAGELPGTVHTGFERHLELCPNCRRYLRSYEETVKLGRHAFGDPNALLPSEVPEELVTAILAARPR
jgi:anti-sigma factor RsiW